ncbi:hypothetical protein SAMN05518849_101579 [Sphingobium sp. AP50]|uniref:hypothetical protein n=1 Tax=Sphingobium sp. AP50 TaxID=1884369 RepID=UPI0008BB508F|nr:hypothetical protein [Sphingobium sp. AP50]SEI69322.1 hypothetical protein SAMN05518849_101579 [Sphingobium sp. AP50]
MSTDRLMREITRSRADRVRRSKRLHLDIARSDCGWNILLEVAYADLSGRPISITGACVMSGHPATTALRWVRRLLKDGYFHRYACSHDARRVWLRITPAGMEAVSACFAGQTPKVPEPEAPSSPIDAAPIGITLQQAIEVFISSGLLGPRLGAMLQGSFGQGEAVHG